MIITFYSYKGGSGRTLALANIAVQLAKKGKRVLAVDFDLEAPGLVNYLRSQAVSPDIDLRPGLMDMLLELRDGGDPDWRAFLTPLRSDDGSLTLMTSGKRDQDYPHRVLTFDWEFLFGHRNGGRFLESMRDGWRAEYDFVLIDSRTGITDSGGICTIQLPDAIVAVFTASDQSVDGVVDVLERAQKGRQVLPYDRSPLTVIPLPSRIELQTERELQRRWQEKFATQFARYYESWVPRTVPVKRLLERITLPYVPYFSYGEPLPVQSDGTTAPGSLGYALETVTRLIEGHLAGAEKIVFGDLPVRLENLDVRHEMGTPTVGLDDVEAAPSRAVIRGGVPSRNPFFTGREAILDQLQDILADRQRASVLPETTLMGYGGVGKTQLAIEFVYRHASEYQLIWWMTAEDPIAVRQSLSVLATRLGLPVSASMEQTISSVLDALGSTQMKWLLVYDNADNPSDLQDLMPSAGGHILVTSRNPVWSAASPVLEVDVFTRQESKDLIVRRRPEISDADAYRLAEALGDLPLALEQALSWIITTVTSVDEYLAEFDRHTRAILDEGRPLSYPHSVATLVRLSLERLRAEAPSAAQLLELVAFLGAEPVSPSILWEGRSAGLAEPLRTSLQDRSEIARLMRDLGRYGLARVDSASRLTVHRLVQFVLRDALDDPERTLHMARQLLTAANPGNPDDGTTWQRHAELRPHVLASSLMEGDIDDRRAVLDQLRYIFNIGDFEGCRDFAETIMVSWRDTTTGEGAHDPLMYQTMRRYADALRSLGDDRAAQYARQAMQGMLAVLGEEHEFTMGAVMGVGADLRIAGMFKEAAELDDHNLELHRRVLGPGDPSTLRAMNSVAVNRRWAGDFKDAYELDVEAERQARAAFEGLDAWTFLAIEGQARDLFSLGRYAEGLALQRDALPGHIQLLGEDHATVLRANTLMSSLLRKTGQINQAHEVAREGYRSHVVRFGQNHGQTIAAAVSYANTLRAAGELTHALTHIEGARDGYQTLYGPDHPLTLCAAINLGIIQRSLGYDRDALLLDEQTLRQLKTVFHAEHPFVLALEVNYSNDLSRAHRLEEAHATSHAAWQSSIRVRGPRHPYTLHAAVNTALDLMQLGQRAESESLFTQTMASLEGVYGNDHQEIESARRQRRLECEIEPLFI